MCNYRSVSLLLGITVCLLLLTIVSGATLSVSGASTEPESKPETLEQGFYLPERAIRAQVNARFGQRLSPFALRHLIAARLQNGDFGKRMGSEFLGKRSQMPDMSSQYSYDDPETMAFLMEKKMGSEFLGKR